MSINNVTISGNLTRDAEIRMTNSGMAVSEFGIAVNDRRKNPQTGEWEDYPNFVNVIIFGKRAEALQPYLTKGTKACIQGKLRWSSWEKDGQKHSKLEVIVDEIEFMSRKSDGGDGNYGYDPYPAQEPQSAQVYDDDLPF